MFDLIYNGAQLLKLLSFIVLAITGILMLIGFTRTTDLVTTYTIMSLGITLFAGIFTASGITDLLMRRAPELTGSWHIEFSNESETYIIISDTGDFELFLSDEELLEGRIYADITSYFWTGPLLEKLTLMYNNNILGTIIVSEYETGIIKGTFKNINSETYTVSLSSIDINYEDELPYFEAPYMVDKLPIILP